MRSYSNARRDVHPFRFDKSRAGQGIRSLLHGVGAADPAALVSVGLLFGGVGLLAALLAALPVVRNDPAATLRQE